MVHAVDVNSHMCVIVVAHMAWVRICVPHVRIHTCESGMVLDIFTRMGDTCDVLVSAMSRAAVFDTTVFYTCVCR